MSNISLTQKEIKEKNFSSNDLLSILTADLPYIRNKCFALLSAFLNEKDRTLNQSINYLIGICKNNDILHYEWSTLGGRLKMYLQKKKVPSTFSETMQLCSHLLDKNFYKFVMDHADELDNYINENLDWEYNLISISTFLKIYFMKVRSDNEEDEDELSKERSYSLTPIETPQYLMLRVAAFLWYPNMAEIKKCYTSLSEGAYLFGSAALINAGRVKPQMASCFLLHMGDSIESIIKTWGNSALLSKYGGGLGISIYAARHSEIAGDGVSKGLIPWVKVLGEIINAVNQLGKRKGVGAIYCTDWHLDIMEQFLDMKLATVPEEMRSLDLFYAMFISDEFMRRVENDENWTLFCPNKAKGLIDVWGTEFERLYKKYETDAREGRMTHFKIIKARDLWFKILAIQQKTGGPYMVYKDAVNRKTNHQNLGTIKSSNLCVAPETKILTDEGYKTICELENKKVNVWNGEQFSEVTVKKTGTNKKLLKIVFSNGSIIECTENHRFYICPQHICCCSEWYSYEEDLPLFEEPLIIEAKDLKESMKIIKYRLPYTTEEAQKTHITVKSVTDENRISDTYCFTEPLKHMGTFNGILTGQCTEIMEYTDEDTIASCNLANMNLPHYVKDNKFDHQLFDEKTREATRGLNQVIDRNYYCDIPGLKENNLNTAPLGIGVQGLADTFALMNTWWGSDESYQTNKHIFETMYYSSVDESANIAAERGYPYKKFPGSPISQGILQLDMWQRERISRGNTSNIDISDRYNWEKLREKVKKGVANSLNIAVMPTANGGLLRGSNECIEPFTHLMSTRTVTAGQFAVTNRYMIDDLTKIGLWTGTLRKCLSKTQDNLDEVKFEEICQHVPTEKLDYVRDKFSFLQKKYKTAYNIPQKILLQMSLDRGPYVCQSQSLNYFTNKVDLTKLSAYHFFGWKNGIKTGMYYLRQKAAVSPINFAIDSFEDNEVHSANVNEVQDNNNVQNKIENVCYNTPDCLYCS